LHGFVLLVPRNYPKVGQTVREAAFQAVATVACESGARGVGAKRRRRAVQGEITKDKKGRKKKKRQ
jgi:hypothetical protein